MMKMFGKLTGLIGVAAIAIMVWFMTPALSSASGADGRKVFTESGCQTCHSVSTAGIEAKMKSGPMSGPDMVNLGKQHNADWLAKYLRQQIELDGKNHRKPFKGSDEELQALIDWLLEQKSE